MKKFLLTIAVALIAVPALAQPPVVDPNKPDAELTKEEAQIRITEWTNRVNGLQSRLDAINGEITTMDGQLAQAGTDLANCNRDLYALVGATDADVANFRERLGRIESRAREMGRLSDDQLSKMNADIDSLEGSLNGMRREKISLLPEFYNRIIDLAREIRGLHRTVTATNNSYTVGTWAKDKDCLWNISGKQQIYNDPFMWPKIWQANSEKIRNPDVIFPGQVLTIPPSGPKNDAELRAERVYYRKKRASAAKHAPAERTQQVEQQEAGSGGH